MNIGSLVDDCLTTVFDWLPLKDRLKAELVCRHWNELIGQLWMIKPIVSFKPADIQTGRKRELSERQFILVINKLGQFLRRLTLGDLNGPSQLIHTTWIDSILENCRNLQHLSLVICKTDCHSLVRLAGGLGNRGIPLRSLSLRQLSTPEDLTEGSRDLLYRTILSHLSLVESLAINDSSKINGTFICGPLRLKKLCLSGNCSFERNFFKNLGDNCGDILEELSIPTCGISETIEFFPYFCQRASETLKHLDINCVRFFDRTAPASLSSVATLRNLTSLHFCGCSSVPKVVNDQFIEAVASDCTRLKTLSVPQSDLTDAGVSQLKKLRQLEVLDLSKGKFFHDWSIGELVQLTKLKELYLCHCKQLQGSFLRRILVSCQQINALGLYSCNAISNDQLSEETLDCLAERNSQVPTTIFMGETQIRFAWLMAQTTLDGLKLNFDSTSCSHDSSDHLHPCHKL